MFTQTASTPISVQTLRHELRSHPDKAFISNLCDRLQVGFDTKVSSTDLPTYECRNLLSARNNQDTVSNLLQEEVSKGFMYGPFQSPPFVPYRVSPLGLATHKYSGKQRLIIDLSSPHNNNAHTSINDLIDKDLCSLSYVTIDDAIAIIKHKGKHAAMCKADITDAFKQIPIHPSQWHLFCVKWNNSYYHYVRLPFGSRSSPKIFDQLSQAIVWIAVNNYGISNMLHLLDDFLTVDDPSHDSDRTMALITMIFNKLQIPLSKKKTIGPTCIIEYLGIILDSNKMEARLPLDKVYRITEFITDILSRKSCTRKELEQLLGHLNFAMRVILPGRAFVSYLYRLMSSVKESYFFVHLTSDCKDDLYMWLNFLEKWNGVSLFYEPSITIAADFSLFTDAASTKGFGGFFKGRWFSEKWPCNLPDISDNSLSMAFLELYPIVVAAILWGNEWSCKRIKFYCDNQATVHIITKGRSKDPTITKLMRTLTMCAANSNFAVYSEYYPGVKNNIADALSRFQISRFRELAPTADLYPTQCPPLDEILWRRS
ncbi:uncharacterized protein LOC117344458 isoform X1 [Pecten maximus]|uniref:uncharacterized protein LOC117344458 isoform X1 n=1 Tax=Pecten maximus TaxID=6579 RepID=UPI0014587B62|nr:uncharacterized protein LOC117344458 isoform X1 [Pecten maximus]